MNLYHAWLILAFALLCACKDKQPIHSAMYHQPHYMLGDGFSNTDAPHAPKDVR